MSQFPPYIAPSPFPTTPVEHPKEKKTKKQVGKQNIKP